MLLPQEDHEAFCWRKVKPENRKLVCGVCAECAQAGCVAGDVVANPQWLQMWGVLTSSGPTAFKKIYWERSKLRRRKKKSKKKMQEFKEVIWALQSLSSCHLERPLETETHALCSVPLKRGKVQRLLDLIIPAGTNLEQKRAQGKRKKYKWHL